jgi:hypothetical protein
MRAIHRCIIAAIVVVARILDSPADAQSLGQEFQVNTHTTQGQYSPCVAAIASDGFLVVWEGQLQDGPGAADGVRGRSFAPDGTPDGGEMPVNNFTTGNQRRPVVAGGAARGFLAVWQSDDQDTSSTGIYGRYFDTDGLPDGTEFRVNSYVTGGQFGPAVAGNDGGEFIVVWTDQSPRDPTGTGVFGQRFAATGEPAGAEFRVNAFTTGVQINPAAVMNPTGGFVVVWESEGQDGSQYGVFGRRFGADGTPLGGDFQVNTYTLGFQVYPAIAGDDGGFVVVWESSGQEGLPPSLGLFARRFGWDGTPVAGEFGVNSHTAGDQSRPSVAVDGGGGTLVVWQSSGQDGSGRGVFGRRLDSSGRPAGVEFQINAYTTNSQAMPTLAASGAGDFVVTWQSDGQEGPGYSHYGIFARTVSFRVFTDGFESGDVCSWSSNTGGGACP